MIGWLSQSTLMRPEIPDWLEEIGDRLSNCDPQMVTLELTHQRMDDAQARFVAEKLRETKTVKSLLLSCYNLVDDGAIALAAVLARNKTIHQIQLRDLRNSRESTTFFQAMATMNQLEELSFRNCQVDVRSSKYLGDILASNSSIQELRFVDCQLIGTSLSQLCRGIQQSSKLRRLHLINTEINGEYGGRCLGDMLRRNTSLHELCLGENNLGDEGAEQIADGLLENSTLETLDLRSNEIGRAGCSSLSELIRASKSLVTLVLGMNLISDQGVVSLCQGLCTGKLRKIDLSDNGIGPVGAKSIADILLENTFLEEINISFNDLGDVGATSIASVLHANSTLRVLSLRRIKMSNDGAHALARQLPMMRGLKELVMTRNKVDRVGASALLDGVRRNMELEYLHIEGKVSDPILREIIHWIRLNKAGRRVFRDFNLPVPVWPEVLSKLNANFDVDILYHFVAEKPDIYRHKQCIKVLGG